jgi:hypothetical protein
MAAALSGFHRLDRPDKALVGQHDSRAMLRRADRGPGPGRPTAEHKNVRVELN